MFRGLVLIGFTYMIMHLHTSGNLSKYINMKYSYLSFSAMMILGILTIVQILIVAKDKPPETECAPDCCDHDHSEGDKWYKRWPVYIIFLFPIISGLFFPVATLDSSTVRAKGFHFPVYEESEGDPFSQQQFLKPDTSGYYGQEAYDKLMKKEKKQLTAKESIIVNDENYMNAMETIYNYPGEFMGKEIKLNGFVYKETESRMKNQLFLFRFGIIHCIADSGVFGMLAEMPEDADLKNDQWIEIKGILKSEYYQPFNASIPVVEVKDWKEISAPKNEYVYRKND